MLGERIRNARKCWFSGPGLLSSYAYYCWSPVAISQTSFHSIFYRVFYAYVHKERPILKELIIFGGDPLEFIANI